AGQVAHAHGIDQDVVDVAGGDGELVERLDEGAAVEAQVAGEVREEVGLGGVDLVEVPIAQRQGGRVGRCGDGDVENRAVVCGGPGVEVGAGVDFHGADDKALRLVVEGDDGVGEDVAEVVGVGVGEAALDAEEVVEGVDDGVDAARFGAEDGD